MLENEASRIAREQMKCGFNCCESVLIAITQVFDIPLEEDLLAAASLFGHGMGAGCTCGALVGMVMASGVLQKYAPHPLGPKLSAKLHNDFKDQFGATCCRVIRKRRNALQNIGNRGCIELTAQAAEILVREWEEILYAKTADIDHHSNA